MEDFELIISIHSFGNTPVLSINGIMDAWHEHPVDVALKSFIDAAERELILDVTRLLFTGSGAAAAFLGCVRALPPEIRIHVIAVGELGRILQGANLGPCITVSDQLDDLAESLHPEERYLTSRWLAQMGEEELPMAA